MAPPLSYQVAERVSEASQLYHRLVLVVGPARSGKTAALFPFDLRLNAGHMRTAPQFQVHRQGLDSDFIEIRGGA